jgi:2-polyprenyl-6-methoxyphenol hydroxylase-like FAD-dependent oxidoreductase
MGNNKLRIGIIGAGTAGLATAIAFARSGHHVQVFEKHPALATFGAGLLIQPQGVRALSDLGLRDEFEAASVPIDRLLGKNHRGWRLVDITYSAHPARAVSRSALAHLLLRSALAAGVHVQFKTHIDRVETNGNLGQIVSESFSASISVPDSMEFDLVVIADGAASVLPAQAGLAVPSTQYKWGALWAMFDVENWQHERLLQQRFRTTREMFGLMPTERHGDKMRLSLFWSLPCSAYDEWKASSLEIWKNKLIDLWPESTPVISQINSHDQLTFATYYHARPQRLANPPICIVGDAAHAMSPQLGLGATLAVQDALALAKHVNASGVQDGTSIFSKKRLPAVRAYQTLSRALTPCFQANGGGWWRDILFASSLYVPGVPWLMHRSIAEPQLITKAAPKLSQV